MFDRKQAALKIIGGLSNEDVESISGLRLKQVVFAEFAAELRDNLPTAYDADAENDPTDAVSAIVDAIVPTYGDEVMRYFINIDVAFELPLSDVEFDPNGDVSAFLISVLEAAYEQAVNALIAHVEELVDEAEQEADEAELDDDDETDDGKTSDENKD